MNIIKELYDLIKGLVSNQRNLGLYDYQSSTIGDTIGDTRTSNQSGIKTYEYCTVAHATKGSGTWIKYSLTDIVGNSILPKTTGIGIKLDTTTPSFGFKDLIGQIVPRPSGGPAPTLSPYHGTKVLAYAFAATPDVIDNITFHVPHDYLPNSELFLHMHWGHNGTTISGNFIYNYYITYCKGYNQTSQIFNAELTIPQTIALGVAPQIANYPRWMHHIQEVQITSTTPDTTHLDRALIEIDGLIMIALNVTTIPTISGGTINNPFIFTIDLHYQSTGLPTINKNYPFYSL